MNTKTCSKCRAIKPCTAFGVQMSHKDGLKSRCRLCRSETERIVAQRNPEQTRIRGRVRTQRYRRRHPDRIREGNRRQRKAHPRMIAACKRRWNEQNPDRVRAWGEKRRTSPKYQVEAAMRSGLHRGIVHGSKNGRSTFAILGYTCDTLMEHLEAQFGPDMSWANYGEWHIDHIVPLSSFSYETPSDPGFRAAWQLQNLQPLWAVENMTKGSTVPGRH